MSYVIVAHGVNKGPSATLKAPGYEHHPKFQPAG